MAKPDLAAAYRDAGRRAFIKALKESHPGITWGRNENGTLVFEGTLNVDAAIDAVIVETVKRIRRS